MPALRQHGWKADAIGQDDAADRVATFKGHKGAMWTLTLSERSLKLLVNS